MKETTQVLKDLFNDGFELITIDDEARIVKDVEEDRDIYEYMLDKHLLMLSNPTMARFWYFTSLEHMVEYFNNGGKVGYNNHAQILL